jgi:cytochrome P450
LIPGLLFAEGDAHRKQRKIMNPSFSTAHIRSLMPTFYDKAQVVRDLWADTSGQSKATVNVLDTLSRMTLDIIGLTGFDYPFDALTRNADEKEAEHENEFSQAFATLSNHSGGYGWWNIIINWFPILYNIASRFTSKTSSVLTYLDQPTAQERRIQNAVDTLHRIGGQLIMEKKAVVMSELCPSSAQPSKGLQSSTVVSKDSVKGKDLLSLLIRANMSHDLPPNEKLSDHDVMSQISTFVVAGHETTSTSLSWTLHTLTLHPAVQDKLRTELMSVGSDVPSLEVLEGLPYLDAVVREALRWCAVVPSSIRTCMKDDMVPIENGTKMIKWVFSMHSGGTLISCGEIAF